jgi:hypothetical protein
MTEFHGDFLHYMAICAAKWVCEVSRDFKPLNATALKNKGMFPAIPDLYYEMNGSYTDQHGRKHTVRKRYVVEIETCASKESVLKKWNQYEETLAGVDLIIIDLNQCENPLDLTVLSEFINEAIP